MSSWGRHKEEPEQARGWAREWRWEPCGVAETNHADHPTPTGADPALPRGDAGAPLRTAHCGDLEQLVRARQKRRLPVVLTPGEVRAVLERMNGVEALVSEVLYGSGLRLMEALRLRVKDLDFERRELTVRDGKGSKDRRTMLPLAVGERLREQLREVKRLHEKDLADGYGRVQLPGALRRKYRHADREWTWQWVFPQHQRWRNDKTGEQGRHHLDPSLVQKAIRRAVIAAEISKPATSHSLRHS